MTPLLKQRISQGRVILFLGAGASVGCNSNDGKPAAPLGGQLKNELVTLAALDDAEDDDLQDIYCAAQKILGAQLQKHLEERYSDLKPANSLLELAKYPWPRIYTTNIDDAMHQALVINSSQKIMPRGRSSASSPINSTFKSIDLVFLNGYVVKPKEEYIFTSMEYARAQAAKLPWFKQLVRDFYEYTFLFIGTRLKEPTFYYHIATHSQTVNSSLGRSFLLLPKISSAQKEALRDLNVEHIEGTAEDFASWLKTQFPNGLDRDQVLTTRIPILSYFSANKPTEADLNAFDSLTVVSRNHLPAPQPQEKLTSSTVDFYKGFKPTWSDIVSSIPAEMEITIELKEVVHAKASRLIILYGPMGSGKSTTLMQAALKTSDLGVPTYHIRDSTEDLKAIVHTLEKAHADYTLFIDRASRVDRQLRRCFCDDLIKNGIIVCGERESVWYNQTHELFAEFEPMTLRQHEITAKDADSILHNILLFAPAVGFTGLGRKERKKLLLEYSKKQLLIGLFTATYGLGYRKMIIAEYESLVPEAQTCLLLVGLATHHDLSVQRGLIETILRETFGVYRSIDETLQELKGIVREDGGRLYARHPTYINEIFRSRIARDDSEQALVALTTYFSSLPVPISKHRERLGRSLVDLFKKTVNHSFVSFLLKEPNRVLNYYRCFERPFSQDGLFWLQMGLAYRNVGKHEESLDALESAMLMHPMTHTQHALAQQKIILASKLAISGESSKARVFLDDGMSMLRYLDALDDLVGGRYYPIVALSEGHVFVAKTLDGEEQAKKLAREYSEIITQRMNREGAVFRGTIKQRLSAPQVRAKKALKRLNGFIYNGRWEFGSELAAIMTTDLPDASID